jgi:hypothetical protein
VHFQNTLVKKVSNRLIQINAARQSLSLPFWLATAKDESHIDLEQSYKKNSCAALASTTAIMGRYTAINNHWFVSVEAPSGWRPTSPRTRLPRKTKAFPTEAEAKQFAMAMLLDGCRLNAGTLSPHQPIRRQIAASDIKRWIEEKE